MQRGLWTPQPTRQDGSSDQPAKHGFTGRLPPIWQAIMAVPSRVMLGANGAPNLTKEFTRYHRVADWGFIRPPK